MDRKAERSKQRNESREAKAKRSAFHSLLSSVCFGIFLLFPLLCPLPPAFGASPSQLKEGNRQFKNGHYERALELYQDGLIDAPYSAILHFNAGDATMMMGEFPKAEVSFTEAAKSANPILRGASHYNRGNALFYQGKWEEAVEAFKDSLRANPQDEDAKYNLGVALKAMKNPPASAKASAGKPPKQDQNKGASSGKKDNSSAEASREGGMSKEDAERLLSAAASNEKKKGNQQAAKPGVPTRDEDW